MNPKCEQANSRFQRTEQGFGVNKTGEIIRFDASSRLVEERGLEPIE